MPDTFDTEDDAYAAAIKGSRGGRTGGGTGVGAGGGFGGAFGGGGSGFLGGGGTSFGGDLMGQRRRFIQGANGQLPVSYTPLKNPPQSPDNVPAMLSPGEYVVNNRAMQLPGAQEFVSMLNAAGNGGRFAEGGQVIDMDMLVRLLSALSGFVHGGEGQGVDGGEMDAEGGPVPQHFAWGGAVQGQQGGFNAPRMPQNRFAGPGATGVPRMGQPAVRTNPRQPVAPVRPPGSTMSGGPYTGGSGYQPFPGMGNLPSTGVGAGWVAPPTSGSNPDIGSLGDLPAYQQIAEMLRQFGAGGAFSPEGSAALMRSVQGQATSNADAMRARQQNALQLGGMDAGQAAAMKQMADLRGQGDVANALNAAQYGQLASQDAFGKSLIGQMTNAQMQEYLAQLAAYYKQRTG